MQGKRILIVPTQPENRFDQEVAAWFFRRGGRWTGTASELLASVEGRSAGNNTSWPRSSRELYEHLQIHRQTLESLGVYFLLLQGVPRMVSLRSRQDESPVSKISSSTSDVDCVPDSPSGSPPLAGSQKESAPVAGNHGHGARREFGGRVFKNTGEALVAIGEMRHQIREESLGLESAADVVINRAKEITESCEIKIGFLPRPESGQPPQIFGSSSFEGLPLDASLFQPNLRAGEIVAVDDAQQHPLLGPECHRSGIASLIILPIVRDHEVVGAMQFLFREKLDFSPGDVMDLGLIAGVISESFTVSPQIGVTESEELGSSGDKSPIKGMGRRGREVSKKQEKNLAAVFKGRNTAKALANETASPESAVLNSLASSRLGAAPAVLWRALRKAWTGQSRHV